MSTWNTLIWPDPMRYSIMLQIVVGTTLILVGAGAYFAWLQNRPQLDEHASHFDISTRL